MNVLFDGQVFVHQQRGGVSRYFANLASHIDALPDCRARVLAPLHHNEHLGAESRRLVIGLGLKPSPSTGLPVWLATRTLSPALGQLLQADIVHETYFAPKPYVRKAKSRVTTVYDMIHEIFSPGHANSEHKKATLARCDHALCISENTRKDLIELFDFPPQRTSVTPLGYQDFSIHPGPAPAAVQGEPYLLYVGPRDGYKNFAGLLRAYASRPALVKEMKCLAFGGGPLTSGEQEMIRSLGLMADRVVQTGGSDAALGAAYANALAFVYPSHYEGFGLPPLEAMSAGCPVLSSNTSSLPEVVGEAALAFDPTDVEAIASALERVAQSAELRADLVARGHRQRAKFTWQRCAADTLATYRMLV